jgi:drug/metabolite transporter (DMT)-like permease
VESLPPFLLGGVRFLVAGGALYAVLSLRGAPPPSRAAWAQASLSGVLMIAVGNGLVSYAETHVASNLAALLIASVPLQVALLDWLRPGGTRPEPNVLLGIGLGAGGMLLLLQPGDAPLADGHWTGVVAVLLAGTGWAAGTLCARHRAAGQSPALAAAQQMLVGGGAMLVVSLLRGEPASLDLAAVSTRSLLALAYLTLFGSLLAFSAFSWLLSVTSAAHVSTTAYVNPLVAVVLGWLVLDESLPSIALAGAVLILGSVALTVRRPAAR